MITNELEYSCALVVVGYLFGGEDNELLDEIVIDILTYEDKWEVIG